MYFHSCKCCHVCVLSLIEHRYKANVRWHDDAVLSLLVCAIVGLETGPSSILQESCYPLDKGAVKSTAMFLGFFLSSFFSFHYTWMSLCHDPWKVMGGNPPTISCLYIKSSEVYVVLAKAQASLSWISLFANDIPDYNCSLLKSNPGRCNIIPYRQNCLQFFKWKMC